MPAWRYPSPRRARADVVEGLLQRYAPGDVVDVGDVPYAPAVCPACHHLTDDEMLVSLGRVPNAVRTRLSLPVDVPAMCHNACLETWLRHGGRLADLYAAIGADKEAVATAAEYDRTHPGRLA